MPTKKILSEFEERLQKMSPAERKSYFSPYFPDRPDPKLQVQIGSKQLQPYITTEQVPTKFVKGTERLATIRKENDQRVSSKSIKTGWDCAFCFKDESYNTQQVTGKSVNYRCLAHVGELIDPEHCATRYDEKWFKKGGLDLSDCPDYVPAERVSKR